MVAKEYTKISTWFILCFYTLIISDWQTLLFIKGPFLLGILITKLLPDPHPIITFWTYILFLIWIFWLFFQCTIGTFIRLVFNFGFANTITFGYTLYKGSLSINTVVTYFLLNFVFSSSNDIFFYLGITNTFFLLILGWCGLFDPQYLTNKIISSNIYITSINTIENLGNNLKQRLPVNKSSENQTIKQTIWKFIKGLAISILEIEEDISNNQYSNAIKDFANEYVVYCKTAAYEYFNEYFFGATKSTPQDRIQEFLQKRNPNYQVDDLGDNEESRDDFFDFKKDTNELMTFMNIHQENEDSNSYSEELIRRTANNDEESRDPRMRTSQDDRDSDLELDSDGDAEKTDNL